LEGKGQCTSSIRGGDGGENNWVESKKKKGVKGGKRGKSESPRKSKRRD